MFPLVSASALFALCGLVFKDSKFSFPSHAMGGQQGFHYLQQGLVPSAGEKNPAQTWHVEPGAQGSLPHRDTGEEQMERGAKISPCAP